MKIKIIFKELKIVLLVSRDVCRAAIKERMMYGFLLLAFLFILMANVPFVFDDPKIFGGQSPAVSALQIGFMTINVFTILIAIFVSVNTLQIFLSKESLVLLLSKPVRRWQIFQGIVLGLFEMVFLNWFLMTMGLWCVIVSQTRMLALPIWSGMSVTVLMALLYVSLGGGLDDPDGDRRFWRAARPRNVRPLDPDRLGRIIFKFWAQCVAANQRALGRVDEDLRSFQS
jgi:ABC-type transport system involved in multi-copper enzyme maturation permease subunit